MTASRIIRMDPHDDFGRSCFSIYRVKHQTDLVGVKRKLFSPCPINDVIVENATFFNRELYVMLCDIEKCGDKPYIKVEWTIVEGCNCELCTGKSNEFTHDRWVEHNMEYDRISNADEYTKQSWREHAGI